MSRIKLKSSAHKLSGALPLSAFPVYFDFNHEISTLNAAASSQLPLMSHLLHCVCCLHNLSLYMGSAMLPLESDLLAVWPLVAVPPLFFSLRDWPEPSGKRPPSRSLLPEFPPQEQKELWGVCRLFSVRPGAGIIFPDSRLTGCAWCSRGPKSYQFSALYSSPLKHLR